MLLKFFGEWLEKRRKAGQPKLPLDAYIYMRAFIDDFDNTRSPTLRAADTQAIELLEQVRDSFTKKGKLPPAELVLHAVNEALEALGRS